MVQVNFANPSMLIFLALIPALLLIHFWTLQRRRSHALSFANFNAIARIKGVDILSKNLTILSLNILVVATIVLALSGMSVQREELTSSFSFVIALDTSQSMEANDFLPNRLEAAKESAITFSELTQGAKIAVLSFSGNALIEQPLTNDRLLITQAIKNIPISSVGGTDVGEAVITSSNLLEGEDKKAIVLISDGRITVNALESGIDYAISNNVIVHTIGIGTVEGGLTSLGGLSTIDEDALKSLSYNTRGQYFNAEDKDKLEESLKTILDLKLGTVYFDATIYLLIFALFLIIVEFILINTRYRTLP